MLPSFEEKENCLKQNISHVSYSAVNKKERIMSEKENSYDVADNDDVDDDEDEIYLKQIENGDSMVLTKSNVSFHQNFADCSNVFKAFIGSAMIGLPFAVHQAGIGLAIIGIIVIAIATDHCCALIVKVKRLVISKIGRQRSASKVSLPEIMAEADLLGRTLSFGGIGKVVFGKKGVLSVNIAIMTTQIGFTTGYFIFLGNTMRSVLKTYLVHPNHTVVNNAKVPAVVFRGNLNDTLTAGGYNAIMTPYDLINTTLVTPLMTSFNAVFSDANNATNVLPQLLHSIVNSAPLSPHSLITNSTVTFGILLLIPLPILVLIAFIRKLRKLGPISVIANTAILGAFAATATYIIFTMKGFSKDVEYFKFATFPIFYGQVTSAFEGIGTVIPIEGSMAENRARYPLFLHGTIVGISLILGSFGIVGYSAYGDGVCQIITSNLSGIIPTILQCLLFVGVLFTYPLQIYPCIEITEHLVLKFRKWRMVRKMSRDRVINSDEEGLLEKETAPVPKPKVKTWEGNLIRACLVTFTAVLGLFFRSQFAYMAALTGSIGSSFLLYILPPAFHIALTRKEMKWYIFAKDVLLIIFGIVGGGVGVTIAIQEMVESFSKGHPVHC